MTRRSRAGLTAVAVGLVASLLPLIAGGPAAASSAASPVPPLPPGADVTTFSAAQLAQYGLPPRPSTDSPKYPGWYQAMKAVRYEVQTPMTVPASVPRSHKAPPPGTAGYSTNWAGQASTAGPFNAIQGSWNVPSVSRTDGNTRTAVQWVGIGSGSGGDDQLVQAGSRTYSLNNGQTGAYTWWEIYPDVSVEQGLFWVNFGDSMFVSLYSANRQSYFFVEDATTGQYWNNNGQLLGDGCSNCNQAEGIVERDSSYLTWFNPTNFSGVAPTNGGGTQYLGNLPNFNYVMAYNPCCWLAWPSSISGGSFTVYRGNND